MQKLFSLLALFVWFTTVSANRITLGTYTHIGINYEISASEIDSTLSHISIECRDGENCGSSPILIVRIERLDEFRKSMEIARGKFRDWEKVANENGVDNVIKEMPIEFPKLDAHWWISDESFFASDVQMTARCTITKYRKHVNFNMYCVASDNKFITTSLSFFLEDESFDNFLDAISEENLTNKIKEYHLVHDLFK